MCSHLKLLCRHSVVAASRTKRMKRCNRRRQTADTAQDDRRHLRNVRSHEEDFALSGRRVGGGSKLADSSNRLI